MNYPLLLSPVTIGKVTLKNRISSPDASLHLLQGPETFPADGYRAWVIQMAKSCAYLVMSPWSNPTQRTIGMADSVRMQNFDMDDPSVSNYFSKMCDDIHFYGSKLLISTIPFRLPWPDGYNLDGQGGMFLPGQPVEPKEALPAARMGELVENYVRYVANYKTFGYDGVSLNISMLIGKNRNHRTDLYGCDTPENAARLPKLLFGAIKERLGRDFITEAYVYGEMDHIYTKEFMAAVVKELEDVVDIVSIKEKDAATNHPTGFQFTKGHHPCFAYAKAIRDTGAKVLVGVNGGFQDPQELDEYLAAGDCDLIAMARGLFADEDYMEKCLTGRGDDIVPCIWCNKCHGTMTPPWISFCSVNPKLGIDPMLLKTLPTGGAKKKVAIVGGGPIGMRAAMMAAEQGHQVTLFEKTDYLGGQLRHSDYVSFKWPLRDYKDYLVRQLDKHGVTVRMNTLATPELLEQEGFEAVIAATGAVPNIPKFAQDETGKLKAGLKTCLDVFSHEDELGKRVIIVGGSETGVETGMHLCEKGHEVTVLTRQDEIAHDASHLHAITMAIVTYDPKDYHEIIKCAWEKYPDFHSIVNATTTEVTEKTVCYTDENGVSHTLEADSVVICGGMKAQRDEALAFYGAAPRFFMTGDCEKVANLQAGNRSAMGKVAQL